MVTLAQRLCAEPPTEAGDPVIGYNKNVRGLSRFVCCAARMCGAAGHLPDAHFAESLSALSVCARLRVNRTGRCLLLKRGPRGFSSVYCVQL
jgi:hypothetical protein